MRTTARCTWAGHDQPNGCGWTHEGPGSDREAERHTNTTTHATQVVARPDTKEPHMPKVPATPEHLLQEARQVAVAEHRTAEEYRLGIATAVELLDADTPTGDIRDHLTALITEG